MAFCGKLGGLLRQSVSHVNGINGQLSMTSMLNSARWMSSTRLFIGGLSWGTDDQTLKDAFSCFGDVSEARVITDSATGRSKGFGFVNFSDSEGASSAVSAMDGQELNGRNIRVAYANDRPSGPRVGSGGRFGGNGGGGFGGNGGYGGSY